LTDFRKILKYQISDKQTDMIKLLNYSTSNGLRDCAKCAELEIQLQQVHEELSSVQLIIQLLNKECVQEMTATTPIQATETTWEVDKD
jgi:Zn-finger domain-containing protein